MTTVQIVEELSKLSGDEMQELLQELKQYEVSHQNDRAEVEMPDEVLLSSELEGKEEKNRIVIFE